jgi:hypothetical protein
VKLFVAALAGVVLTAACLAWEVLIGDWPAAVFVAFALGFAAGCVLAGWERWGRERGGVTMPEALTGGAA